MQISCISINDYYLGADFCRQSFDTRGVCVYVRKAVTFSTININDLCKAKGLEACAVKLEFLLIKLCI
jgi:hypothetical protein